MGTVEWHQELQFLGVMFASGAFVAGATTLVNGSYRGWGTAVATGVLGGGAAVAAVCYLYPEPSITYSRAPIFAAFASGVLAKPVILTLLSKDWRNRIAKAIVENIGRIKIDDGDTQDDG